MNVWVVTGRDDEYSASHKWIVGLALTLAEADALAAADRHHERTNIAGYQYYGFAELDDTSHAETTEVPLGGWDREDLPGPLVLVEHPEPYFVAERFTLTVPPAPIPRVTPV